MIFLIFNVFCCGLGYENIRDLAITPTSKCFAIWRSRTTEGRRFRPIQKWAGKIAQAKIGQDRLILTTNVLRSGDRELRRRCGRTVGALCKRAGDCARLQTAPTGCFRPRQNVSRSGDRELRGAAFSHTSKMGGICAQAKIGQDRLILTMGYSRSGDRELQRRCVHTVGALCKRAGDCARLQTAPTGCFRPRQNVSRSGARELRRYGVFAHGKIGQDRLILTLGYSRSGNRELQRRCGRIVGARCPRAGDCARFETAPTGCFRLRQNVSRSGDRELQRGRCFRTRRKWGAKSPNPK